MVAVLIGPWSSPQDGSGPDRGPWIPRGGGRRVAPSLSPRRAARSGGVRTVTAAGSALLGVRPEVRRDRSPAIPRRSPRGCFCCPPAVRHRRRGRRRRRHHRRPGRRRGRPHRRLPAHRRRGPRRGRRPGPAQRPRGGRRRRHPRRRRRRPRAHRPRRRVHRDGGADALRRGLGDRTPRPRGRPPRDRRRPAPVHPRVLRARLAQPLLGAGEHRDRGRRRRPPRRGEELGHLGRRGRQLCLVQPPGVGGGADDAVARARRDAPASRSRARSTASACAATARRR